MIDVKEWKMLIGGILKSDFAVNAVMEVFVVRALKKIRKLTSRKQKELRDACDDVLTKLEKEGVPSEETPNADVYFHPFALACATRQAKITEAALDCIQKLIAYGYLRGNSQVSISETMLSEESDSAGDGEPSSGFLIDYIIQVIFLCNGHPEPSVQLQVIKALVTAVTSNTCEVHGKSLLNAVRACYHIHLVSKNAMNQTVAKATLQQMLNIIFQRMESFDLRAKQHEPVEKKTTEDNIYPSVFDSLGYKMNAPSIVPRSNMPMGVGRATSLALFPSMLHKDAYLLFRSLCRLSMKEVNENEYPPTVSSKSSHPQPTDSMALQSKVLALELILSLLENAGPTFKSSETFIHLVREYLCVSLISNSVSSYTPLVHLSLRIFVSLMTHFKGHMKSEIQLFISDIFLRILESSNSPFQHKTMVLSALQNICQDGSMLGEIFLNYDCDWHSIDLFKCIVHALAKSAKGSESNVPITSVVTGLQPLTMEQEEMLTQLKALQCLVAIANSLKKASIQSSFAENDEVEDDDDEDVEVALPSSTSAGISVVEAFDLKRRIKSELSTGILKFNVKPSVGISYLIAHGHLEKTPLQVAQFLLDHVSELNTTQVGDYLGKEQAYQDGFCIAVLHEYVDLMDFTGMEFDVAIRHYLSGFRLPGEAQKIDRMMEKFAERYCLNNPTIFPSADTAFILAFSVIMLQTDLHNPSIREDRKMTKEGFIRNNRGINAGSDLPEDFLADIYDRIQQTPIVLKEDEDRKTEVSNPSNYSIFSTASNMDRIRREAFHKESRAMVESSAARLKHGGKKHGKRSSSIGQEKEFYSIRDVRLEHLRPMFELLWAPLLASISVLLERLSDTEGILYCMNGFESAIHLSGYLAMESERDAFVISLAKFTGLYTSSQSHNLRRAKLLPKQLEGIRALIQIAVKEGTYLQDAWADVLQCISQLSLLHLKAQGMHSENDFFAETPSGSGIATPTFNSAPPSTSSSRLSISSTPGSKSSTFFSSSPSTTSQTQYDEIEHWNATQLLHQVDVLASDRVFSSSVLLADDSIEAFVQQLCVVSLSELSGAVELSETRVHSSHSVYSLQKLVEVADMNMHIRPRIVWSRVWEILGRHFTTIGCHENHGVAMFAIDSLRQLSAKFLEKQELKAFNFQRKFLRPFEIIMANSPSSEIKELILKCVENLILGRSSQIKSGWKSIISVFEVASQDEEESVVHLSSNLLCRVVSEYFECIPSVFDDVIACLLELCLNEYGDIGLNSLQSVGKCAIGLAEGKVDIVDSITSPQKDSFYDAEVDAVGINHTCEVNTEDKKGFIICQAHKTRWWPILTGLTDLVKLQSTHNAYQMAEQANSVLFNEILIPFGGNFNGKMLCSIFEEILFPVVEELQVEPYRKICASMLKGTIQLFSKYYNILEQIFPDVFDILTSCMKHKSSAVLTTLGVECFRILLMKSGQHFNASRWEDCLNLVGDMMILMCPSYLMDMDVTRPLVESNVQSVEDFILGIKPTVMDSPKRKKVPVEFMYPQVWNILGFKLVSKSGKVTKIATPTRELRGMLQTTLELQSLLGDVLIQHYSSFSSVQTEQLLDHIFQSCRFARTFNDKLPLREALGQAGFTYNAPPNSNLPNMLRQEMRGKSEYCRVLLNYATDPSKPNMTSLEPQLITYVAVTLNLMPCRMISSVINEFADWKQESKTPPCLQDHHDRVSEYIPAIVEILRGFAQYDGQKFNPKKQWLYPLLVRLICSESTDISAALEQVFQGPVAQVLMTL